LTSGRIVEVEAYLGVVDKAAHSYGNRRTPRTETMYAVGGVAYIYLCYGIHHLFNVVVNRRDVPEAVLIRAVEPLEGIDTMMRRRHMSRLQHRLTAGPGALSQALGIQTAFGGTSLLGDRIWIEDRGSQVAARHIVASPRVGVGYAEECAAWPLRFRIKNNPWTSRA
jgi:DNA-3-methyladenine glycosylase